MLSRFGAPHLLVAVTLLVGSGLVMVYSASAARSDVYFGVTWAIALRQLVGAGLGVAALIAASRVPLDWLERLAWVCWGLGVLGIALTLGPLGIDVNGARRWLAIGPLSFQPLELAAGPRDWVEVANLFQSKYEFKHVLYRQFVLHLPKAHHSLVLRESVRLSLFRRQLHFCIAEQLGR